MGHVCFLDLVCVCVIDLGGGGGVGSGGGGDGGGGGFFSSFPFLLKRPLLAAEQTATGRG